MLKHLILYTTSSCHLCEEAELLLNQTNLEWQSIEIADSAELLRLYSLKIPVICNTATKKELSWPFSLIDIETFISH